MNRYSLYRCPKCTEQLEYKNADEEALVCVCGGRYPIINDVPRFVESDNYAASFGREWNMFSTTQLDSANGTRISYHRFKQLTGMEPSALAGKRVLEIGCGMGRFLEIVSKAGADAYGIDLSLAVEAAKNNLKGYDNCHIAQASLFELPFGEDFDLIYSFGVIHHTPDARKAFLSITQHLREGGHIVVWVYGLGVTTGIQTRWIPRPYHLFGPCIRTLPEKFQDPALSLYTRVALLAGSIPVGGPILKKIVPIQDLRLKKPNQDGFEPDGADEERREQLRFDWALLSAHDMFTPTYKTQHKNGELIEWANEANLVCIRNGPVAASVIASRPT